MQAILRVHITIVANLCTVIPCPKPVLPSLHLEDNQMLFDNLG